MSIAAPPSQSVRSPQYTPDQLAVMSQDERASYIAGLPPDEQATALMQMQAAIKEANRTFMRRSIEKVATCPPTSGGGVTTQAYALSTTLSFDFPVANGGYAIALLINVSVNATLAAGTGATYAANAACPYNFIKEIDITYNGNQVRTHPYFLKILGLINGFAKAQPNTVVAGTSVTNFQNQFGVFPVPVTAGTRTYLYKYWMPLNALARDNPAGVLPLQGVGNKAQIKLICCDALMGVDPLLNPFSAAGGTGNGVTLNAGASTFVNVDVLYLDGTNLWSPNNLQLSLVDEPTVQYYWDIQYSPLVTTNVMVQKIGVLLKHFIVCSLFIDGTTSTAFGTTTNWSVLRFSQDMVGQNSFIKYGLDSNVSLFDFFFQRRMQYGQDLDEGVVIWVDGMTRGIVDPDNRHGEQALNMEADGWTSATHGYQTSTINSVAGITGRIETFLLSLNTKGLKIRP